MIAPADDIDRIMAVMVAAFDPGFGEAWNRRQLEDALIGGHSHYLLIGGDGDIPEFGSPAAGFSLSRHGFDEEELLLFAVDPVFRRRGLGQLLLQRFADDAGSRGARRLLLEMRHGNPAERLYRSFGFVPIGRRPGYYLGPDGNRFDALTFACGLENRTAS